MVAAHAVLESHDLEQTLEEPEKLLVEGAVAVGFMENDLPAETEVRILKLADESRRPVHCLHRGIHSVRVYLLRSHWRCASACRWELPLRWVYLLKLRSRRPHGLDELTAGRDVEDSFWPPRDEVVESWLGLAVWTDRADFLEAFGCFAQSQREVLRTVSDASSEGARVFGEELGLPSQFAAGQQGLDRNGVLVDFLEDELAVFVKKAESVGSEYSQPGLGSLVRLARNHPAEQHVVLLESWATVASFPRGYRIHMLPCLFGQST